MEELPSKEHHLFKIHRLLMKIGAYPAFYRQRPQYGPADKISTIYC